MHRARPSRWLPFDAWPLLVIAGGLVTMFVWPPKS